MPLRTVLLTGYPLDSAKINDANVAQALSLPGRDSSRPLRLAKRPDLRGVGPDRIRPSPRPDD